jgi:hydrogenase maturation protein HypF
MEPVRRELRVQGVVQGVGLRPWVARRARALGLAGSVHNTAAGLEIALEGPAAAIERFGAALRSEPPGCARIEAIEESEAPVRGDASFRVEASSGVGSARGARVPPDLPLCGACLEELFEPRERRHRYAFTHCAECGPRASVLLALPWDRERTSLHGFAPCDACRGEYANPEDRRYHAETIACPRCGPRLRAVDAEGREPAGDPVELAAASLRAGGIVALLGHGGFHLAVDATNADAVARLRARKARPAKPFAVLVPDLAAARHVVELRPEDEALLAGPAHAIVLAPRRKGDESVVHDVAPGLTDLGVLLPYAPLHWLLLFGPGARPGRDRARFAALVLTSANRSGEPTLHRPAEARVRLRGVADLVIEHDRAVARPNDDPVYRSAAAGPIPIRLSRSTAPLVLPLPGGLRAPDPVAAIGGDLACAPALAVGGEVLLAEHVGDLANVEVAEALAARVSGLCRLLGTAPAWAAHDLHPGYHGPGVARRLAPRQLRVQHHHAHAAACLVDNGRAGPALALALDGLGWGIDGTPWGGELLRVDLVDCQRLAHLEAVPLPGGDAAAREPWRMAAVWLARAFPEGAPELPWHARRDPIRLRSLLAIAARGIASPPTTSCGRLFDAVASLLDLVDVASHEGEAPMALEAAAARSELAPDVDRAQLAEPAAPPGADGAAILVAPLLRAIVAARVQGATTAALARAFHDGLASRLAAAAIGFATRLGLVEVALTGGCFQNRLLLEGVRARLAGAGLVPLLHRRIPPGDGGLAVGQAAIAAARLSRGASAG